MLPIPADFVRCICQPNKFTAIHRARRKLIRLLLPNVPEQRNKKAVVNGLSQAVKIAPFPPGVEPSGCGLQLTQ